MIKWQNIQRKSSKYEYLLYFNNKILKKEILLWKSQFLDRILKLYAGSRFIEDQLWSFCLVRKDSNLKSSTT